MSVLRLLGRNCPAPAPPRRSASRHRVTDGRRPPACKHAQPLTASTPWYGEGTSKTAPPPRKHSAQARRGRRRQRWNPAGAETRTAGLDAQQDSATGRGRGRLAEREMDLHGSSERGPMYPISETRSHNSALLCRILMQIPHLLAPTSDRPNSRIRRFLDSSALARLDLAGHRLASWRRLKFTWRRAKPLRGLA